ncbi:MAG: glycoside hydrolase domain-containing protein, partial [Candidatus Acidiferrales bacterium]
WVTGPLAKVLQNAGVPGTVKWAIVYATQNEIQGFQIHINANAGAISNYSVTMSDLVNSQTSTHISASSNSIVVYREAYMDLTSVSNSASVTFYNTTGYYPDILIPAVDPYYGQTTNAFPFTIASGNNQSVWVDVHVPPTAPSGYYSGTATLKTGSTVLATLPVVYAVWQWPNGGFMPSTSSLPSYNSTGWADMCVQAYGSYSACGAWPGAAGNPDTGVTLSIEDFTTIMLDHRISSPNPVYPPPSTNLTAFETSFGPAFNGTAPTLLSGAKLTSVVYGNNSLAYAQAWQTAFQSKGWLSTLFYYPVDEPQSTAAFANLAVDAAAVHAASPPGNMLTTTNLTNATKYGGLNNIDTMVPIIDDLDPIGGTLQRSAYNAWLAGPAPDGLTRQLWSYISCESAGCGGKSYNVPYPNYNVDGLPVANRAMEWMTFLHNQSGELYYNATLCWSNTSCRNPPDPWVTVLYQGGWGDGTLLYPGGPISSKDNYMGPGVTHPIWLPSLRLKMIRDGMQDYEYLKVLTAAGKGSLVTTQISSWITNSYTFNVDPAGITAARQALGTALHQLTYPSGTSSVTPPTSLGGTVTVQQ